MTPAPEVRDDLLVPANLDGPLTPVDVVHSLSGRARLRVPMLKGNERLSRGLQALLSAQSGITEVTVNSVCRSVTVVYDPAVWTSESLCRFLRQCHREDLAQHEAAAALTDDATTQFSTNWLQPWRFLNATGGSPDCKDMLPTGQPARSGYWAAGYVSLIMGAILVPVPLLPGIPFLILSSYFFARATVLRGEERPEAQEQISTTKE